VWITPQVRLTLARLWHTIRPQFDDGLLPSGSAFVVQASSLPFFRPFLGDIASPGGVSRGTKHGRADLSGSCRFLTGP
jgi:hypothetical protein